MFPYGHSSQPSHTAYSGLSAFAPPFNFGYAYSNHPYSFSSAHYQHPAASSSLIPPSHYYGPYPSYHPPPPPSTYGANLTSVETGFGGAGLGRRDGSYYAEYGSNSTWMDPQPSWDYFTSGKDSLARKGHYGPECSGGLDEKHPSVFEQNAKPAYSEKLLLGQTGMTEGTSKPPDPFAVPERGNVFDFHSSNHGLVDEFGSASTASIFYEPPATCFSSNQLFVSPATASEYNSIPRNEHSTVQDRTQFDLNYDYTHPHTGQDSSFIHPFTGGKDWYPEMSSAANDVKEPTYIPGYLTPVQRGCSSDNESVTGKSMQCAVDISDLRTGNLYNSDSLTSNTVSAEPINYMHTFLETLDHHNLAVDSPCWKGASGSQQSPFSVGKAAEPGFVIKELERSNELRLSKNHLLNVVHSEAMPSAKQEGNLISNENSKRSLRSLVDLSVLLDLQSAHQKANDVCKAKCSDQNNVHEQGFKAVGRCSNESKSRGHCEPKDSTGKSVGHGISLHVANESSSIFERIIDTEKDLSDSVKASAYGIDSCVGAQTVNATKFSLPDCIAETFGSSDPIGDFSSSENNVQRFLKAIHGLSEVLLYTDCIDNSELKEHDYKLLQMIIWNLERFNLKSKKGKSKVSSNISGVDAAVPVVALSKVDGMSMSNYRTRCNISGEMRSSGCGLDDNLLDKSVPTSGTAASIADYIAHALDKINIESPTNQEENLQTKFYKKLWIDAEIASCAIKCELQLLRMNAEMENHKHKAKESLVASYLSAKPTEFPRTLSRDSLPLLDVVEGKISNVKESLCHDASKLEDNTNGCRDINSHDAFPSTIAGDIDSSIMARFRILKERLDKRIADNVEDHDAMGTVDISMQNKDDVSSHPFDSGDNSGSKSLEMMLAESGSESNKGLQNATAELRDASPASKDRLDVPHFSESHNEAATTVFPGDLSINQSYASSIKGKQSSGGYDSSSSEWEHVLDEEFTLV